MSVSQEHVEITLERLAAGGWMFCVQVVAADGAATGLAWCSDYETAILMAEEAGRAFGAVHDRVLETAPPGLVAGL